MAHFHAKKQTGMLQYGSNSKSATPKYSLWVRIRHFKSQKSVLGNLVRATSISYVIWMEISLKQHTVKYDLAPRDPSPANTSTKAPPEAGEDTSQARFPTNTRPRMDDDGAEDAPPPKRQATPRTLRPRGPKAIVETQGATESMGAGAVVTSDRDGLE
ncbi:hypothetical protein B0H19DRAFT_1081449 [Mycena capillaripes]|nr:hypothetical protein B0H19DRAFT_1081449 [Mycena capillaripes]